MVKSLLFVAMVWLCVPVNATTWYVDRAGSDTSDGSNAHPFATIQRAIDSSAGSDTVRVRPGTYDGGFRTTHNGGTTGSFVLMADSVARPVLDGTRSQSNDAIHILHNRITLRGFTIRGFANGTGITLDSGATNISVSDCEIDSCYWGVSVLDGVSYFALTNIEVHHFGGPGGFGFDMTSHGGARIMNGVVTDCSAHDGGGDNCDGFALGHDNAAHGGDAYLSFTDVNNVRFVHCTAYNVGDGFDLSGANISCVRCLAHDTYYGGNFKIWATTIQLVNCVAYNGPANVEFDKYNDTAVGVTPPGRAQLMNCTFVNGGAWNLNSQSDSFRLQMQNCIVAGSPIGINMESGRLSSYMTAMDYNLYHCNNPERMYADADTDLSITDFQNGGWTSFCGQDPHSITLSNLAGTFVDTTTGRVDLHLVAASRAINAGAGSGAPVDDFDGRARSDQFPDVGAYEYGTSGVAEPAAPMTPLTVTCTPTVAHESIEVEFTLTHAASALLLVIDDAGRVVAAHESACSPANLPIHLSTADLAAGTYHLLLRAGTAAGTASFVVVH